MRTPTRRHRLAATGGLIAFAVVLAGCLTPGTYSARNPVNGFAPGLWRTAGALSTDASAPPCYWKRLPAKGPDPGLVFPAQSTRGGPRYVQIDTGDGLVTSGCGNWWQQVPAGRFAKWLVAPGDPFPEGDFAVGPEVAPGTYQSTGAAWHLLLGPSERLPRHRARGDRDRRREVDARHDRARRRRVQLERLRGLDQDRLTPLGSTPVSPAWPSSGRPRPRRPGPPSCR